jgi:Holliday junction resolvase RusA-like endonuclease
MKSEYTMKAFDAFKDIEPLNDELPIYLDITWMEPNRRRDADNVQAGVKFILDGMVEAGFIPNDTQRYVLGTANRVGKAREPYVDVRIIGTYGATATDGRKAE